MGAVQKMSIAVTEELARDIEQAVASGDYSTASEVVRDALRAWKRERQAHASRLRRLLEDGLASGEPIDGNIDPDNIARRGRERLAARPGRSG